MASARQPTEVRQEALVDAALGIIATQGIAALNTRTLATAVGLSSGAIFRHFASLEAVLEAVVARVEAVLSATFPAPDLPGLQRLDRFIDARSTAVGNQIGIMRLVQNEQFHLALPTSSADRLKACVAQTRAFVAGCIRDGQASGHIRRDVDAAALAVIAMGTIQMLALNHLAAAAGGPAAIRAALATLLGAPGPHHDGTRVPPETEQP